MSDFDELLKSLQDEAENTEKLAKAIPSNEGEDDENIEGAADGEVEPEGEEENAETDGDEGKGEMAKSMTATVDGEEVELVDASEMIKSLSDRIGSHESVLAKALETTLATVQNQSALIKSLSEKVDKLAGAGRGRKSVVVTVQDKPGTTLAKSEPTAPAPQEILAKALDAQRAGKITGHDVARCEMAIQNGVAVPADVISKF